MGSRGRLALSEPRKWVCAIVDSRGSVSPQGHSNIGHYSCGTRLMELDDISDAQLSRPITS